MSGHRSEARALAALVVVVDCTHAAEIEKQLRRLGLRDPTLSRMVSGWRVIGSGYLIAVARPYSPLLTVYCASNATSLRWQVACAMSLTHSAPCTWIRGLDDMALALVNRMLGETCTDSCIVIDSAFDDDRAGNRAPSI